MTYIPVEDAVDKTLQALSDDAELRESKQEEKRLLFVLCERTGLDENDADRLIETSVVMFNRMAPEIITNDQEGLEDMVATTFARGIEFGVWLERERSKNN